MSKAKYGRYKAQVRVGASETAKTIRDRIASGEWWVWIPVGPTGSAVLQKIERAFYWDEKNVDFDLAFFPRRMLFVALGRKSRASAKQLKRVMSKALRHPLPNDITEKAIMMILVSSEDEDGRRRAMAAFAGLLALPYRPDLN